MSSWRKAISFAISRVEPFLDQDTLMLYLNEDTVTLQLWSKMYIFGEAQKLRNRAARISPGWEPL